MRYRTGYYPGLVRANEPQVWLYIATLLGGSQDMTSFSKVIYKTVPDNRKVKQYYIK